MNNLELILGITFPNQLEGSSATNSTNKVKKGAVFFGLPGSQNHGSRYIQKALDLGASIAVHNDPEYRSENTNIFYVEDLQKEDYFFKRDKLYYFLEELYKISNIQITNNFYAFTGANGKTSSAYLCHQLLINQGYKSLYIGTLGTQYNKNQINRSFSSKTTPDIFELFEIFKFYDFKNPISICIEMSSHSLDQNRLKYLSCLNAASILNIGADHLDYHKNIKNYTNAKFKIFDTESVVRLIDDKLQELSRDYSFVKNSHYKMISVSNKNPHSDIFYKIIESTPNQSSFEVIINNPPTGYPESHRKKYTFICGLFPEFNIHNLVFALSSLGFSSFQSEDLNDLSFLNLPKGRTELISNISANVIIDFAHNADGFKFFLSSIKNYFETLVIIFGCGGNRDKTKRSEMLKIALENGLDVIFTSDNSRDETFKNILIDASKGNNLDRVKVIEDRKEAIIYGSSLLGEKDCLVILGKGHEETQEIDGKIFHFSDHEVINEIYK
jgi:UDP-N-acetylmuramyl-tripeptide synthetase